MILSDTYENLILDHILGNASATFDSTVFVSLHSSSPGENGANEITDSGYIRKAITFNSATITGATNNGAVIFDAIVDGNVTVSHWGLWTAATGGTYILGDDVTATKLYTIGANPRINDAEAQITPVGNWSNYLIPKIIDFIDGTADYTAPTSTTVHLYTTTQTAADGGTEVAGAIGYTEQTTEWDSSSGGSSSNTNQEDFGPATSDWGTVTDWGVRDQLDNLLLFGAWQSPVPVDNGDDYRLNAGDLTINLT